jgi:hypothetical protein
MNLAILQGNRRSCKETREKRNIALQDSSAGVDSSLDGVGGDEVEHSSRLPDTLAREIRAENHEQRQALGLKIAEVVLSASRYKD